MEEEENNLPKGVLPDNFFDDNVEGAVAMGVKRKQAEKLAKEQNPALLIMYRQEWKEFKKFAKEQAERNDDLDD